MSLAGNIKVGVGPSAKGFWTEFKAQTKADSPSLKVPVNPDLSKLRRELALERKRQEANAINMRVKVDRSGMRDMQSLRREVDHIYKVSSGRKALRIQIAVVGAAALPAAAQGVLSLTTAITELSRAALLLPGVFSGVAAAVGTLATGFKGVGAALKASGDGLKNNRQYARDYERATRDLERAQRDVVRALKDANREIEDQKDKLKSGQLSVEQAQINVQRANERLAKGGFQSMSDWRQAMLDVKQAHFDLGQAVKQNKRDIQDYYDNTVKGATQTDRFKDSVDQLSNTMDAYTKAQLQAAGVSEKFLEAMDNLSPKAQFFVRQLVALKGAWQGLSNEVQDNLFDGLGTSITDLSNRRLPMLRKGMADVAKSLNGDFKQLLSTLGSDKNADGISKIFSRTAQALAIAKPGLDAFVNAFVHLSEAGSRFLPRFANAFNTLGKRFESFIDKADKSGALERWMNRGIDAVKSLFNAMGSLGSIMGSITRAYETATGNVGGFAKTLETSLGKLAAYLGSPAGQERLRGYIKYASDFMGTLKEALPGIMNLIQGFADGLRTFGQITMPIMAAMGNFMSTHIPLVRALVIAWAGIKTVKPIWENFLKIIRHGHEGWSNYRSGIEASRDAVKQLEAEQATLAAQQKKYQTQYMRDTWAKAKATNDLEKATFLADFNRGKALDKVEKAQSKLAKSQSKLGKAIANTSNITGWSDAVVTAQNKVKKSQKELEKATGQYYGVTSRGVAAQVQAERRVETAIAQVATSQKKLNIIQSDGENLTHRLQKAQADLAGDSRGFGMVKRAIGSKGKGGIIGSLGGLMAALGGVLSGIVGGVGTIGLIVGLDRLSTAQQKAGDRAQYHLDKLTALKNALDPATGAVTAEGTAQALEMAQGTQLTGSGNNTLTANAITDAGKLGISAQQLGLSFDPTQMSATNDTLKKADANTLAAVEGGKDEQWNRIKDDATSHGITAEVYAKALNGDQESVQKFNAWREDWWKRDNRWNLAFAHINLPMSAAPKGYIPELGAGVENLYQTTPGISVGQTTRENVGGNRDKGNDFRQRAAKGGLSAAGRNKFPNASDITKQPDGGIGFNVDRLTPQQAEALSTGDENIPNSGATLNRLADNGDGTSRYSVVLPPASPYVGYARGGSVFGAGSATSDSIPAMLSNGEFVINAKSASIIGHDRLAALNGVRHYDSGGLVLPLPGSGNRPGDFNRSEFQSAGQAQAARRGSGPVGDSAPRTNVLATAGKAIANSAAGQAVSGWLNSGIGSAGAASNYAAAKGIPKAPVKSIVPASSSGPAFVPGLAPPGSTVTPAGSSKPTWDITNPGLTPAGAVLTGLEKAGISTPSAPAPVTPARPNAQLTGARQQPWWAPTTLGAFARVADQLPYVYGAGHPGYDGTAEGGLTPDKNSNPLLYGFDCSSLASWTANIAAGLPQDYEVFATGTEREGLTWRGFRDGPGDHGDLVIGWSDSHTGITLPDGRNFEAVNRDTGIVLGKGTGTGGANFPNVMHLPASMIKNAGSLGSAGLPIPKRGGPNPGGSGSSDPQAFADLSGIAGKPAAGPSGGQPSSTPGLAPSGAPGGVPGAATAPPVDVPPGIPGINAPIPGPFGDIPLQPFDFLKTIGMAILQAIFGFFGIDISGIVGMINGVVGGIAGMGKPPGDVPDPNVDPGADPEIIKQLNEMADQAHAAGDYTMEGEYRQMAKDYQARKPSAAPGAPSPAPVKKARGGHIRGPGSGTSDSIPAMLSNGEYVLKASAVRAIGVPRLNALNSIRAFDSGGDAATGGGRVTNPSQVATWVDQFAQTAAHGQEYVYGGYGTTQPWVNPDGQKSTDVGYDCSGIVGSIWAAAQGLPPNAAHYFSTGSFINPADYEKLGFKPGFKAGALNVGVMNAPGEGANAHMAATLPNGVNVESAGSYGSVYGGPARGAKNELFPNQFYFDLPSDPSSGLESGLRGGQLLGYGYANGGLVRGYSDGGPVIPIIPPPTGSSDPQAFAPLGSPKTGSSDPQAYQDLSSIKSVTLDEARRIGEQVGQSGGSLLGSALAPKGGMPSISAGVKQPAPKDPRSILAQAPTSSDHNNPALSGAIKGAAGTIGALAGSAAAAGLSAVNGVAPGAGSVASGAASQLISAGAQMAGEVANGAVNVLSSLLVGTVTPSETGQGYGAPLTPTVSSPQTNFQSIHNGNVVTNNLSEYSRLKDRKDAQRALPLMNRIG